MQAPIARRFVPNVCSALGPPGACSQANFSATKAFRNAVILILVKWLLPRPLSGGLRVLHA